jgi:CheY-like chemotaxis protein
MKDKSAVGRILVMDDEAMILDVAGRILTRLGYEVEFAGNGEQAITRYSDAHAAGKPFDLVIMDLTVPGGMGGRETVKRLRELDPSLKAIVSSGSFDDPVMANYMRYGFNGMVSKPYTIKLLGDTVMKVISSDTNPSAV